MYFILFSGICNLSHLEEERTHRLPVELEDGAGIIDIFVTITGTTPLQEATNYGESSANLALESMPSKLTDEEIRRYVRIYFKYITIKNEYLSCL